MNAQQIINEVILETKDAHKGINWKILKEKVEADEKLNNQEEK